MYGINRLTCIPDLTAKIDNSLQTKNNSPIFFFNNSTFVSIRLIRVRFFRTFGSVNNSR